MKTYTYLDEPIKIYGIPFFEEHKTLQRLPDEIVDKLSKDMDWFPRVGRRTPGARLAFRTDSKTFKVKLKMKELTFDVGMSPYACQSAHVFVGDRANARHAGLAYPETLDMLTFEEEFTKEAVMEDIMVFFPIVDIVEHIEVSIEDNADILPPTPYKHKKPIVYFGSSITEGCACSMPYNAYSAILSRRLDIDYYNLGFSSSAKGQMELADFINKIDMSVFFLDYDHNAPTAKFLEETHEPFFKRIREKNPTLPVVMMSCPNFDYMEENAQRREIIKRTYNNAVANGDKNVYFIDGETFFGDKDRHMCTIDTVHPNDLGVYRMANVIEPVLRKITNIY